MLKLRPRFTPFALSLFSLATTSQAQTIPNSGQLLQQVLPRTPISHSSKPVVVIDPAHGSFVDGTQRFSVSRFDVSGNTTFPTSVLHALVVSGEGHQMTITALTTLAQRITDYYRRHGYPLARAIIPAQTLDAGTVRIVVVEARYDKVLTNNKSRVSQSLLTSTLASIRPSNVVSQSQLDDVLLRLAEFPGVSPHAILQPGVLPGTSTLNVDVLATPTLYGNLSFDDEGTRYTGRFRTGVDVNIAEPLHHGDVLGISALTAGSGLRFGRLNYEYTLTGFGTRAGLAYSHLSYELGGALRPLRASGTARASSAWVKQPLLRSARTTADIQVQYEHKQLHDHVDAAALRNDRHAGSTTVRVIGQHADLWWGSRGSSSINVGASFGKLDFDLAAAAKADAATARTEGSYMRWNASVAHLQNLTDTTRLYVNISAQRGSRNLDSSEQFLLGGSNSVRGYDVSVMAGDSGWISSLELRHDLNWACLGICAGKVFIDRGSVRFNVTPFAPGSNHVTLSSVGIGFDWLGAKQWRAQVQLAQPVGPAIAASSGKTPGPRLWVVVSKGF